MAAASGTDELAVVASGLRRVFGATVAVDGLDLRVPRGCVYGFLGPNGSGKSTALRMMCGLLTPTSGSVRVLDLEMPRQAEALKRRMGYMTQRFSLYDDLTVSENLRFLARIRGLGRRRVRDRVAHALERHHLEALARRRTENLSGGERQRLALAGATLHEPELLLLDEPTSAVDPQSRRDFWATLFELVDEGATILVSTHYMDEAERCHYLAILDHGRVAANDTPENLIAHLPATVLEIEPPSVAIRELIDREPAVLSTAQIGHRLRVLVDPGIEAAPDWLASRLAAASLTANVHPAQADLEDVFVASTRGQPR